MKSILTYAAIAVGTATLLGIVASSRRVITSTVAPRGYEELDRLAKKVDPYIDGFSLFARATAHNESRGNSGAVNSSPGEAAAACRGYERNRDGRFRDNPYPPEDWCWGSGGWFGFIPSTALAAPGFESLDPLLVLDPEAQVAMFGDYVRRVVRGSNWSKLPEGERNWLAVRRFMAGNTVGLDWEERKVLRTDKDGVPRARKVRERFARSLEAVGIDPDFMYQPVHIGAWPGAITVWEELEE